MGRSQKLLVCPCAVPITADKREGKGKGESTQHSLAGRLREIWEYSSLRGWEVICGHSVQHVWQNIHKRVRKGTENKLSCVSCLFFCRGTLHGRPGSAHMGLVWGSSYVLETKAMSRWSENSSTTLCGLSSCQALGCEKSFITSWRLARSLPFAFHFSHCFLGQYNR